MFFLFSFGFNFSSAKAHAESNPLPDENKVKCGIGDKEDPENINKAQEINIIIESLEHKLKNLKANDNTANLCIELKEKYKTRKEELEKTANQCKEARQKLKEVRGEFSKHCGKFSVTMKCGKAIEACEVCPNTEDIEDYNCVKIHNQTKCPVLLGEELKTQKERRDKNIESRKELEESFNELEKDIAEKENDLNNKLSDLEAEFSELTRDLERQTERQKEELENKLNESKAKISGAISQQIAEAQKTIDSALKIAHAFENAITKANMDHRKEKRQVYMECELQAQTQLNNYRKKRRRAIKKGSYKISLSSILKQGRNSFAQKDLGLFKKYNSKCLSKRREDFKSIDIVYNQKLRQIEQQQQEYEETLNRTKKQLTSLNAQAYTEKNKLVKTYSKNVEKILENHQKEYNIARKKYAMAKNNLLSQSKTINILKTQLSKQGQQLREKEMELLRGSEMIAYLKEKGVSSEEEQKDAYSSARSSYIDYQTALSNTEFNCDCIKARDESNHPNKNACEQMLKRAKEDLSETDFDNIKGQR